MEHNRDQQKGKGKRQCDASVLSVSVCALPEDHSNQSWIQQRTLGS